MTSPPDLLQGLLDDNLAAFLDDIVTRDGQGSVAELPTTSDTMPFGDFLPTYTSSLSGQHVAQGPTLDPVFHYQDYSNDNEVSRKRSGSGEGNVLS